MTTITDTNDLVRRIKSLGEPRSEAEGRMITEALLQCTLADTHTATGGELRMSLAARAVYETLANQAERTAAALLYAIRVLRGMD